MSGERYLGGVWNWFDERPRLRWVAILLLCIPLAIAFRELLNYIVPQIPWLMPAMGVVAIGYGAWLTVLRLRSLRPDDETETRWFDAPFAMAVGIFILLLEFVPE